MPNISQLPFLASLNGTEEFPVRKGATTYGTTTDVLAQWVIAGHGINRPPQSPSQTATALDTDSQLTGNLFTGVTDPDGDAFYFQSLSYNGTTEDLGGGSFQTTLGIFFLNQLTADWTFTLGQGARALNVGQVGHEVFTYTIADGKGGITTSNLTISITGTNSVPVVNSVNNYTPINTRITGNLIAHYAFDYESTLSVLHFKIAGDATTYAAGSSHLIASVGTIEIDSNGDYEFDPLDGWFGPVPLITYTLIDVGTTPNQVDAYLTLAITPLAPGAAPIILYTTQPSGPVSNGPNGKGCFLTLCGFRFGTTSGLGTTTKVYIGTVEVAAYFPIQDAAVAERWTGMQALTVQVNNMDSSALGKPFPVTMVVGGNTSNANNTFIPNPGNFYYASLGGSDSTGAANDITKPFRHIQLPARGDPSIWPLLRAGDQIIIRGGEWSDIGYATCWARFRDPIQQGYAPTGVAGTGWISFTCYPNEDVHYTTPPGGNSGGIEGPGDAFSGTTGDFVCVSNLRMEVSGGSSGAAAPVNMQYNTGHWWIVNNKFGPWVAGTSSSLNAACVTGQGNFIRVLGNYMHDIEGTSAQQNHGIYAGTSAYGWEIAFNWLQNMVGGSHIQFNDSDGGTGNVNTPYGVWQGFTDNLIHHNFLEVSAKYGISFSDVGAYAGDLSAKIWNNIIVGTGLVPFRLNTTTLTSDITYAFNTAYDCMRVNNAGTGNAYTRNEGNQTSPNHAIKFYNNIFAFGPNTTPGCQWHADPNGQSSGYSYSRNLYWGNGQSPTNVADSLAIYGNPKFTNAAALDFSLLSDSPAVNSGTQALPTGMNVTDDWTAQATRQFGGAPDVGALEVGQTTPYVITSPTVTGSAVVGGATSCSVGSWGNSPTSYTRQAYVNGVAKGSVVTGTGAASYTAVAGDAGLLLTWQIGASNDGVVYSLYTISVGTVAVAAGAPVVTVPPAVTGTAQVPNTLSSSTGTWTYSGGVTPAYSYQWLRNGVAISGATSSTYAIGVGDVSYKLSCKVTAIDATHGNVSSTSTETATVLPAAADPTFVQLKTSTLRSDTTAQAIAMDSDVVGNNLLITFCGAWDQHTYNFSFSDTQGHTSGSSSWSSAGDLQVQSNNPCVNAEWLKSNATGAYTQSINTNASQGGVAIVVEVTGIDTTTFMDLPSYNSTGSSITPAISGAIANTKPNDLVYVMVAVAGATGATCTTPSGWTSRGSIAGGFQTMFLFERKETAVETFAFSATLDSSRNWGCISLVVKGS